MLLIFLVSGVVAAAACIFLLRYGQANGQRYGLDMPQRFHAGAVPRLGGAGMLLACTAGWVALAATAPDAIVFAPAAAMGWWTVATMAAGAGLVEDVTHRLTARLRLLLTLLSGALATAWFELVIGPLGFQALAPLWQAAPWLPPLLAVFAVAGLPHAFNLIDGYNGLAGSVALICSLAIAVVALQVGDREIAAVMLVLAGATAGFLLWNYPRGLIFAGDGGAYLWGAVIAVASVLLVQRHPQVSPWFPALLLIYPVWETIFSIYRKLARGQSPGTPDALHFHQLICRRIVRPIPLQDRARRLLVRNNRTAPYLWTMTMLAAVPAVLFWRDTRTLIALCALFIVSYLVAYFGIVRFKVPRWMRR